MRLPAEAPQTALAHDEALLDAVRPSGPPLVRSYIVDAPALVLGLGLRARRAELIDDTRCRAAGIAVLERRAGGGALLLDESMLCYSIALSLPHPLAPADLTESYRWLGDDFAARLAALGLSARRVEVAEARQDVAELRDRRDPVGRLLLASCYGALSPHEVVLDSHAKIVGLAQVRRRHAALFQVGVLLRDQSALADLLRVEDEATREAFRAALRQRSAGLFDHLDPARLPDLADLVGALSPASTAGADPAAAADASAVADARPAAARAAQPRPARP